MSEPSSQAPDEATKNDDSRRPGTEKSEAEKRPKEIGGRGGLDPTRYGDWEMAGRCIDF